MAQTNPISQNIRRIRIGRGLSQEDAAVKAGISRNAYRSIETGRAEPRVSNLQGIARALSVALPELLAEPPHLSSVRFRSTNLRSGKAQARRDQLVVNVARWLKDFNALEESLGRKKPYVMDGLVDGLGDVSAGNRPIEAARKAREVLGLKDNEPIHDICGLLESAGVKVLTQGLPIEDLFGLSVASSDGGPAVVVNIRLDIPVERRIFTAAHEFGHLLLHPHTYNTEQVKEDAIEEDEAHLFAAHFLMPNKVFQDEWRNTCGLPFVDRVLHVKRIFHVSYMTVLYRLIDLGQVDREKIWMIFKTHWKRRSGKALTKKVEPMPLADLDFLEDRLSRMVREAIESEKITISRGAEILGVNLIAMRDMIASWEVAA